MIGFAAVVLVTAQVLIGIHLYQQGQRIPQQQGKTFSGKTIDIIDPREGHLTLVNFWASSCLPCIKEMPDFIELHHTYRNRPFSIVGITMPFDQSDLSLAVLKSFRIPWENVLDPMGHHVSAFGDIKAVPTTLLLDHQGSTLWKQEGPVDFQLLKQHINRHLPASSPAIPEKISI
jgi:thiol-disulfide isomerase/thioredoxin